MQPQQPPQLGEVDNMLMGAAQTVLMSALLSLLFYCTWLLIVTGLAVHCIRTQRPENKTPWIIVVLTLPIFGWLAYLIFKDTDSFTAPMANVPPPPKRDIAANVSDALSAEVRKRRTN